MNSTAGSYTHPSEDSIDFDEPVSQIIMRDIKNVSDKMLYVLKPTSVNDAAAGLRDWELWGPLLLCISLSVVLFFSCTWSSKGSSNVGIGAGPSLVFTMVYILVGVGSCIVTANAQLLGSRLSFFQSVCVLGYCLVPLAAAAALNLLIISEIRCVRLVTVAPAFFWATRVAAAFMESVIDSKKKALAVYPVVLFYVAISVLICAV